jgi:hypothetical protein
MEDIQKIKEFFSKPLEEDFGQALFNRLNPKDEDLEAIVNILIQDPKIRKSLDQASFKEALENYIRFNSDRNSIGQAAVRALSYRNTGGRYGSGFDKIFNMLVDKNNLSKSLEESLTGGYPYKKTSGGDFERIDIAEPMDNATRNKMIKNFRAAGWDAKPSNRGGIVAIKRAISEAKTDINKIKKRLDALGIKYEMSITNKVKPFKVIYKPVDKSDEFYDKFNDIIDLYNLKDVVKLSISEAKEDDVVDTITMDIPLFIRMLEYSREDAAEDMDLHDVTEKAIALNKEKTILSMDDYDAIVGGAEEIQENKGIDIGDIVSKKYASTEEDYTKEFKVIGITGMSATLQDTKTGKKIGVFLNDISKVPMKEATSDYMKRRKAQDDYVVSKKDKPAKSYNPTPSGKTDYMKRREKELAEAVFAKLKK